MIRSLLSLTAAIAICVLLVACEQEDPEFAGRDKGPRPPPPTPEQAPQIPEGDAVQQSGAAPGGAPAGGGRTGG